MNYKITALFLDPRREFPHRFSELLWPQIQFSSFDRVARVSKAFQQHMAHEFSVCFISDRITEKLDGFFVDIAKLGRNKTCVFVKVLSAPPEGAAPPQLEPGFHLAMHEDITKEDHAALQGALGVIWHKCEVERRGEDLDGLVSLLMRLVDDAASSHRRGKGTKLHHGATSLVRMHAEFDAAILDQYMNRLVQCTSEAEPSRKRLKSIPLPLLTRKLPELSESGYQGASSRVFNMLVDKFGEEICAPQARVSSEDTLPANSAEIEQGAAAELAEHEAGE